MSARFRSHNLAAWLLAFAVSLCCVLAPVQAQPDGLPTLALMETAFGAIDDDTPEVLYEFEARAGETISVLLQAVGGTLDPLVQVLDPAGEVLAEADDIAYPDRRDAALEAVELPRAGTYTIRATRFNTDVGQSAGDYALTLLPAAANPIFFEPFDGTQPWMAGDAPLAVGLEDGQLALSVDAANTLAWAAPGAALTVPLEAYMQVEATVANDPAYWEYGLIFRQTSPTDYYVFAVSSRGDWALLARTSQAGWQPVQDWTADDALADLAGGATLGVVMDGEAFTFYVNGAALATVTADIHNQPGGVGLSVGTADERENGPVIRYDNLLVTEALPAPVVVEEAVDAPPLESWLAPRSALVLEELAALGLVPAGGSQVMLVPESFTSSARAGMHDLTLGQGREPSDFVMSTTVTLEDEGAGNACGLIFRRASADRYSVVYIDGVGGYGLAAWQGARFDPAFYAPGYPGADEAAAPHLLLIAQGDQVWFYVNGELALTQASPALAGAVGIVSMSYDGHFINCNFADTWLWTWE